MSKRINILSLAGGGARGLLSTQPLRYIEHKTGRHVHELFQFVAGTSTGALQALALTRPAPLSGDALDTAYQCLLPKIFKKRFASFGGLRGSQYVHEPLEVHLQAVLGSGPLSECLTPTAVVTYNLTARLPLLMGSYNAHAARPRWEAARASSAAPTFFEPFNNYVDGGLNANSNALWALFEACRLYGVTPADCNVLSLGTGSDESPIDGSTAAGWGKLNWIQPVLSVCMDGSEDLVDLQLAEILPAPQYLRLQCRISGPLAQMDNVRPENLLALRQRGNQLVAENLPALDAWLDRSQK